MDCFSGRGLPRVKAVMAIPCEGLTSVDSGDVIVVWYLVSLESPCLTPYSVHPGHLACLQFDVW